MALDLHHIVHREHGQAHVGLLEISGKAPDGLVFARRDPAAIIAAKFGGKSVQASPRGCDA